MRRLAPALWLAIDVALIVLFFQVAIACRACDITGVFDFCGGDGPHEIVQDPPAAWRANAAAVQRELYEYTRLHSPADTARFVWRDSSALIFVRVLGHGVAGAGGRENGDTVFFNAGNEANAGLMRHEYVHWVQPENRWLQPNGNIHYPPIFNYVRAPLSGG